MRKGREWTYVAGLVDMSGSMAPHVEETVTSFDGFLARMHEVPASVQVSLAVFNDRIHELYTGEFLANAQGLRGRYDPEGGTALRDSIMAEIQTHEILLQERGRVGRGDGGGRVIVAIITDGCDTDSRTTLQQVQKEVKRKEKDGWEFLYIGPKGSGGDQLGIKHDNVYVLGESISAAIELLAEKTEQLLLTAGS